MAARGLAATILSLWSLATVTAPAFAQGPECADLAPSKALDPALVGKPLDAEDLVRLRDIGQANTESSGRHLFSISPDGRLIAFQLRRADPRTNSYCLGMFVVDTRGTGELRQIDAGGEFIMLMTEPFGRANLPLGVPAIVTPYWSPDGRWVAYLKKTDGKVRVWRSFADGSGSQILAQDEADIDDFRISGDGASVIVRSKTGLNAAQLEIASEARNGFHFDDRATPTVSARPLPRAPLTLHMRAVDIVSGVPRSATPQEAALFGAAPAAASLKAVDLAPGSAGRLAWTSASPGVRLQPINGLHVRMPGGGDIACTMESCSAIEGAPWWTADGKRVRYFRREGWANSLTAIYEWPPGEGAPRRLYSTDAYLIDCQPAADDLFCLRETSLDPRQLVRLTPATGKLDLLAQPNPEIVAARKGAVERIFNRNEMGVPAFGDLVYPVGYKPGVTYPLIVVQYISRGFLRGGVGEEYPIQALANRGYAVLSVHRPHSIGFQPAAKDWIDVDRLNLVGFADRRNVLSTIELLVAKIVERGIADPKRIGLTGLSDGGSTVQYSALHSRLFSAAVVASCCWERSQNPLLGPKAEEIYTRIGWPKLTEDRPDFWKDISLAQNPDKLAFPLLMQLSDSEYLVALESYAALKQAGMPVDLFVFPDEYHIKWQPAHRLASYLRTIDWFDFWFKGERPSDPRRREEVDRWATLGGGR